jgi:hypothetical protein
MPEIRQGGGVEKAMDGIIESLCSMCGTAFALNATGRPRRFCGPGCRRAAELKIKRLQSHLERLEQEGEALRRDRSGLSDVHGNSPEQRAEDVARETETYERRLRDLLAALEGGA